MIFAVKGHIPKLKSGAKRRTRRNSDRYRVNHTYAIQPGRTKHGIKEGRILILRKRLETKGNGHPISEEEALLEGGYTPEEFEELYKMLHKQWVWRYAYDIEYVKTKNFETKNLDEYRRVPE